jgi:type VI secretion system protein VasD
MMRRRRIVTAAGATLVLATLGLAAGCSSPEPQVPEPCDIQLVTLNIYAGDTINPTDQGRPRPVVVRLYQLANDIRMVNASYDRILLHDADELGADLLKVDEVEVYPNDLVQVKFERIPEATFLAGVALFRDPVGQSWKTFYEFPPMPNAPEQCGTGEEGEPQAFPETAFFVVERKIDNGSEYDASMFPNSTPIRKMNLPKRSAASDSFAKGQSAPQPAK